MQIIGIDCATVDSKTGLARGSLEGSELIFRDAETGGAGRPILDMLCAWLDESRPALLALDAPLGWPELLGNALTGHSAGDPLQIPANQLFRRYTDRVVEDRVGRQPLDVGADRIARTAYTALALLEGLRQRTGDEIPLSGQPRDIRRISAIEVYPAATLATCSIQASGYKEKEQRAVRGLMLDRLGELMQLPKDQEAMLASADALDAAVCALAGADYLRGIAVRPPDEATARKEGWIWVRSSAGPRRDRPSEPPVSDL